MDKKAIEVRIQYYIDTGSHRSVVLQDLCAEGVSEQMAKFVLGQLIVSGQVLIEEDGWLKWNYPR